MTQGLGDVGARIDALIALNPWAAEAVRRFPLIDEEALIRARRAAATARLALGAGAWNAWAATMMAAAHTPQSGSMRVWRLVSASDFEGQRPIRSLDLAGLDFPGDVLMRGVQIDGDAWLNACTIQGDLQLGNARITNLDLSMSHMHGSLFAQRIRVAQRTEARGLRVDGAALCSDATFEGDVWARPATGRGGMERISRIGKAADFSGAAFHGEAGFGGMHFVGPAVFRRAHFANTAGFDSCVFANSAEFVGAAFAGRADFRNALFHGPTPFSGALLTQLTCEGAQFEAEEAVSEALSLAQAQTG